MKKQILIFGLVIIILATFVSGCIKIQDDEDDSEEDNTPEPQEVPNITGVICITDSNITMTLSGEFLDYNDAKITVTGPDYIVGVEDDLVNGMEEKLINCYFRWVDINDDSNIGEGDKLYIYNDTGLKSGDWSISIIQQSSGIVAYFSGVIDLD